MRRYAIVLAVLVFMTISGCHAVKGLAKDTHDIAQAAQDGLEGNHDQDPAIRR